MFVLSISQKVQIRHATRQDLPSLEWDGEYKHFRHVFSEAYRLMELGEVIMWIADLPEYGLIGQLFIQLYGPKLIQSSKHKHAYIYGFRVRPQFQGKGIGSQMLRTAESNLVENGFQRIALNVARENDDARRLYERFGYRVVAPEPGIWSFLDDKGRRRFVNEPAWRMEKKF